MHGCGVGQSINLRLFQLIKLKLMDTTTTTNASPAAQGHGFTVLDRNGDISGRFESLAKARQWAKEIDGILRTANDADHTQGIQIDRSLP